MLWTYNPAVSPSVIVAVMGLIPQMLTPAKQRARDQLDKAYQHGGGWLPLSGWELLWPLDWANEDMLVTLPSPIRYPGDPVLYPVAWTVLHEGADRELVVVYSHAWVAIIQPDGAFEVARMD